jgi:hypothetical protein
MTRNSSALAPVPEEPNVSGRRSCLRNEKKKVINILMDRQRGRKSTGSISPFPA